MTTTTTATTTTPISGNTYPVRDQLRARAATTPPFARSAVAYTHCERCGLDVEATNEFATGPCPRCSCDLRVLTGTGGAS